MTNKAKEAVQSAEEWFEARVDYFSIKHPQQKRHTDVILQSLRALSALLDEGIHLAQPTDNNEALEFIQSYKLLLNNMELGTPKNEDGSVTIPPWLRDCRTHLEKHEEATRQALSQPVQEKTPCQGVSWCGKRNKWVCDCKREQPPSNNTAIREWQPIETAPRDTPILVLYDHGGVEKLILKGSANYFVQACCDTLIVTMRGATHWMPLPDTKAIEASKEE